MFSSGPLEDTVEDICEQIEGGSSMDNKPKEKKKRGVWQKVFVVDIQ